MAGHFYREEQIMWASKLFLKIYEEWLGKSDDSLEMYHYTSTEVMDKILGNATFRASNIFYLNDASEYWEGVKFLSEHKKSIGIDSAMLADMGKEDGQVSAGLYTVSFSQDQDSLHQWITYAKESGVALKLDHAIIQKHPDQWVLAQQFDDGQEMPVVRVEIIKPLKYNEQPQNDLGSLFSVLGEEEKAITDSNDQETIKKLALQIFASYIKDPQFNSESEVRITVMPMESPKIVAKDRSESTKTKLQYFPTKGILRPYLNLTFKRINDDGKVLPTLPLERIIVGPSGHQQIVFDSVVHRVTYGEKQVYQYGLEDIKKHLDALGEMIKTKYSKDEYVTAFEASWLDGNMKPLCERFGKNEEEIRRELGITETASAATDSAELVKTLDKIRHDFYMTSEGIIIHKSDIPYVF